MHGLPRYARSDANKNRHSVERNDANKTVIANEVKQSMTSNYLDCRVAKLLAMTTI